MRGLCHSQGSELKTEGRKRKKKPNYMGGFMPKLNGINVVFILDLIGIRG